MTSKTIVERNNRILATALKKCATGERDSFTVVYNLTSRPFFVIVSDIVGETDAQDVLQQAYLSVWRNASKYDPARAKAFTWMLVIMRNQAIDSLRKRHRAPVTCVIDDLEQPDENMRAEFLAEALLLGKKITYRLEGLPISMARALKLQAIYGLSASEIAQIECVSVNTVKSWIRRGIVRLKEELTADGLAPENCW